MERYLSFCLDSVLSQTLKDIEVICVNDGSTDASSSILKEYALKDERIVVVQKENEGVAAARNDGMDAARGEFVCFIDPDDLYPEADVLEVLYRKAHTNGVAICGGSLAQFDTAKPDEWIPSGYDKERFNEDALVKYSDYQFDYGFTRFIYNREFLHHHGIRFRRLCMFEDPPFLANTLHLAQSFYAVNKLVYAYRIKHKPLSKWSRKKTEDCYTGMREVWDIACRFGYSELKQALRRHIQDFIPFNRNSMTEEEALFVENVDTETRKQPHRVLSFFFSKQKELVNPGLRRICILGIKFQYIKSH